MVVPFKAHKVFKVFKGQLDSPDPRGRQVCREQLELPVLKVPKEFKVP
jgi:hypothetical protein